jgi:hypothetical protein
MKKKVVTGLAVQSEKYGIGHAARLNSLLNATKESGWSSSQFDLTPLAASRTELSALIAEVGVSDCLVLDVDPRFVVENFDLLDQILRTVNQSKCILVLFDSGTNFPIRQILTGIQFDLTICPYGPPGVEITKGEIIGFGATIFDASLEELRIKYSDYHREPLNFLIACGGSDPLNVSTMYLRSLNQLPIQNLDVKIVIGPHFPKSNLIELMSEVEKSKHQIQFINSPSNLTSIYLDVDIALVTGGLTRNEVLFLGIPSLVTDLNVDQEVSTQFFESGECLFRAGTCSQEDEWLIESMRTKILELIASPTLRERMSSNARLLMPGGGSEIILREIERICTRKNQL